jgi:hypothetical protein
MGKQDLLCSLIGLGVKLGLVMVAGVSLVRLASAYQARMDRQGELAAVLESRPYWRGVGDLRLLRSYERARKAELALIGGAGDALQQLFSRDSNWARSLRNAGMRAFERSGPLKTWVAERAMGLRGD